MKPNLPASLALVTFLGTGGAFAAAPDGTSPSAVTVSTPPAPPATGGATPAAPISVAPAPAAPASQGTSASPGSDASKADGTKADAADEQTRSADRAAYFEARLAALHAGLTLSPAQEALWPPIDKAMREIASLRKAEWQARMVEGGRGVDSPPANPSAPAANSAEAATPFDLLHRTGEQLEHHGRALQALADAAKPMFANLSLEQKNRLPVLLKGLMPQRGPIERMLASLGVGAQQATGDRVDDRDPGTTKQDGRRGDGRDPGGRGAGWPGWFGGSEGGRHGFADDGDQNGGGASTDQDRRAGRRHGSGEMQDWHRRGMQDGDYRSSGRGDRDGWDRHSDGRDDSYADHRGRWTEGQDRPQDQGNGED